MSNDVVRIKEKLDFVELMRSYVTLIPAGRSFKALCPFHGERTPSFVISPERQLWHCFGACGEGGDIVKFVMKYENIDFPEALRYLAERAGITLLRDQRTRSDLDPLYSAHEAARDFYISELKNSQEAIAYLKERGLSDETIDAFQVGYAPYGDRLTAHLSRLGFSVSDLQRSGLSLRNTRGLFYDRFQERIVFPISNSVGRVVAFTGRILPRVQSERAKDASLGELPKYLNSAESPIYNKSKILYAFNLTKSFIQKSRAAFLVEGQMDALMACQAGVKNVVAVSGTGFTEEHGKVLRRLADTLIVSFDSDEAGQAALLRTLPVFLNLDFHVSAVNFEPYKDPADAVQKDPNILTNALASAKPVFHYIIYRAFAGHEGSLALIDKRRIVRELLRLISYVRSAVERDEYLSLLARIAQISPQSLYEELRVIDRAVPVSQAGAVAQSTFPKSPPEDRFTRIADRIVLIGFTSDEFFGIVKEYAELLPERHKDVISGSLPPEVIALYKVRAEAFVLDDKENLRKELTELVVRLKIEHEKRRRNSLEQSIKTLKGENPVLMEEAMKAFQRSSETLKSLEEQLM